MRSCQLALLVAVIVAGSVSGASAGGAAFHSIEGMLPEYDWSVGNGVSADGSTVVGSVFRGNTPRRAFSWRLGSDVELLDVPSGGFDICNAFAVSGDGSAVVGVAYDGAYPKTTRWTVSGGAAVLGVEAALGMHYSDGLGVSYDGTVALGYASSSSGSSRTAYRWSETTGAVALDSLPGGTSSREARAMSNDGAAVVGASFSSSGFQASFWRQGSPAEGLGDLPGGEFYSFASDISGDGLVVVGSSKSRFADRTSQELEAFRWTRDDGLVNLSGLPDGLRYSRAQGVSADGSIVVGLMSSSETSQDAFIWDDLHGMRVLEDVLTDQYGLDLTGWRLDEATGISDDGRVIVGNGKNPRGNMDGWVAVIPEPATLSLLALGGLAVIRRRKQRGVN